MQHEGESASVVIQKVLLFMGSLMVIILALWKAQGDVGSASSILHCCALNKEENYQTHNSFLVLHYEAFCCLPPCGCS